MATNITGELDITQILLKILEKTYGFEVIYAIIIVGTIVASTYFITKSGLITGIRDYSEHRRKKRNEQISEQEKLLDDIFLKEYSNELSYHVKVSKLENYLNINNKDLDLLTYILSCRDRLRAVNLYKKGKDYLEKDKETKKYKLKSKYTPKRLRLHSYLGTVFYFAINFVGAAPYIILTYLRNIYKLKSLEVSYNIDLMFFGFFISVFIFSLYVLWGFLKPEAAQNFLKLEKISPENNE
ncbi:dipeptide/tripeptide permease [Acinetobacter bereziniae]|uniref:hypothetical protein n=1 Tax=Acinetobacter bereziniae TaxID=106648 RepID=UPI002854DE5D|nr:hypothetical protein [Acinetobacter bereziniae]MDR6540145.1 dipeptide/tripeptide permease [Acinetobacter bereziniae]